MTTITAAPEREPLSGRLSVAVVLVAWFAMVVLLGAGGLFESPSGSAPIAIGIGFAAPLVLFFAALRLSQPFKALVSSLDLRLVSAIQAWRFAGFGFLALYAYDVLPASFALPAGLGDIAIGLSAPWIVVALIRRPGFAGGTAFKVWNALGVLDLLSAVATGALGSVLATGALGEITTAPTARLPLVLIPAYFVPIFLMLHITALIQARRAPRVTG
jgi:hypothetical protein